MSDIYVINKNTWRIEDNGVRFFLLEGKKSALLIDTGMNTPDAKEIARTLTAKPLLLINTHGDPDHTSGNEAFDSFFMSPLEKNNYSQFRKNVDSMMPVNNKDVIDLGGRELEIISLPGHTPGSIAILDISSRVLYGGDAIQNGHIFMFGQYRDMKTYISSLKSLKETYGDRFDVVYPSHGTFPVEPSLISDLIDAAKDILSGRKNGKEVDMRGTKIKYYDFGFAGFLCEK